MNWWGVFINRVLQRHKRARLQTLEVDSGSSEEEMDENGQPIRKRRKELLSFEPDPVPMVLDDIELENRWDIRELNMWCEEDFEGLQEDKKRLIAEIDALRSEYKSLIRKQFAQDPDLPVVDAHPEQSVGESIARDTSEWDSATFDRFASKTVSSSSSSTSSSSSEDDEADLLALARANGSSMIDDELNTLDTYRSVLPAPSSSLSSRAAEELVLKTSSEASVIDQETNELRNDSPPSKSVRLPSPSRRRTRRVVRQEYISRRRELRAIRRILNLHARSKKTLQNVEYV